MRLTHHEKPVEVSYPGGGGVWGEPPPAHYRTSLNSKKKASLSHDTCPPSRRQLTPDRRQLTPNRRQLTPDRHQLTPNRHQLTREGYVP